ncbi:MAG: glycosyltransferase family 2 protein [Acidimicrobiales bacterium]
MSRHDLDVAGVVVDYHAGAALGDCIDSLHANGVATIVVVENGLAGSSPPALAQRQVVLVEPGQNLGYGRGVNRGAAATGPAKYLLVANPDLVLHDGAVKAMVDYLEDHHEVAVVGPQIERPDGSIYPSHRVFPNLWLAGAHALLESPWPDNPATRIYRSPRPDGTVDWVSGACFVIRRDVFEEIGGFDERYFMFAEDMALCWEVRERGYGVAAVAEAVVTHIEGLSRQRASRVMVIAHHKSALRFEMQTARGLRRALVPLAALVLGLRLFMSLIVRPKPKAENV